MAGIDQCEACQSLKLIDLFYVAEKQYVKCTTCGLIFLKGKISRDDVEALYKTDAYQRIESQHRLHLREAVFQKSLELIEKVKKPSRLLDVGCGDGLSLILFYLSGKTLVIGPSLMIHAIKPQEGKGRG